MSLHPRRFLLWAMFASFWAGALGFSGNAAALDLSSAGGQLDSFMRMRASNDGREAFANWWVTLFAVVPGERPRPIMRLDGFNVGRFVKLEDGSAQFITREVAYYKDLASGEVLSKWVNPFTQETNTVVQVANDPVNSRYPATKPGELGRFPFMQSGNDIFLRLDIPLAYPNALLPAEFPAESTGSTYLASEHFTFFAKASDLNNTQTSSVPLTYSWSRTGPWLPWMKMGTRPGYLLYSGHGKKFSSFAELPLDLQEYTRSHYPQFQSSPTTFTSPNETSWTYYKKLQGNKK